MKKSLNLYIDIKKDSIKFEKKAGISYDEFFPDNLKSDYDLEKRFYEIIKNNKNKSINNKKYNWFIVQAMNLAKRRNEIKDREDSIKNDFYYLLDGFYYYTGISKNTDSKNLWDKYKKAQDKLK